MKKPAGKARTKVVKGATVRYRMHLFVTGEESNSQKARQNLKQLCEDHLEGRCQIEITDVLEDFQAAADNEVFLTPALIVKGLSSVTIYGNLSDNEKVLNALRKTGGGS